MKVMDGITQISNFNTVVMFTIYGMKIEVLQLFMTLIVHAIKRNNIKTTIIMLILLTIFLIILLLSIAIYLNTKCNHLKYKNRFFMDSLSKIDTARLDYHSNKDSPNKMELFYRRRLLSTLDDILITLFHH
nr:MAG TPA: hypothetical protein [Caudoviricetes sp.]